MKKTEICSLIINSIKEFIFSPDILEAYRAPKFFVRKRKLSMLNVILFLLHAGKGALETSITSVRDLLCDITDFPKTISKQAISHARQGICFSLFYELFNMSTDLFYSHLEHRKDWYGYHLFAIDGSKIELPNSKSNFDHFGEMFEHHNPERKFTQALASIVYDVLDDFIIHATFSRFLASERSEAVKHMMELEELGIYEDSVIIFDRGYYSETLFRYCVKHGHLCLMRLKQNYCISRKVASAGKGGAYEHIDVLKGDPTEGTEDIKIRVIAVKLSTGEIEYLATNLFDEKITTEMFRELYFKRWPVETKYFELKNILHLEEFSGATPNSAMQEFYITLLYSNLASMIKADADAEIQSRCRSTNKYRYQANRTFIIGQFRMHLLEMISGFRELDYLLVIFEDACHTRSQIKEGRKFKRDMRKLKNRKHFRNRKLAF